MDIQIKRIGVIGRGAIGAVYCAGLRGAGFEVVVLGDSARLERYRAEGLYYNGVGVEGLEYGGVGEGAVDLVIIASKWGGYEDALGLAEGVMGRGTLVLPLLNGILPYEMAVERFGVERVRRGFYLGTTAMREGNRVEMRGAYNTIMEGGKGGGGEIQALFDRAGISYRVEDDIMGASWQKMVINCGFNQVSALDGGKSYGEIRNTPELMAMCEGLMAETAMVARGVGVQGTEDMVARGMNMLGVLNAEDYTSMAQDIRAGRETEWEIFGGYLLEEAQGLGLELPLHTQIRGLINKG